MLLISQAQEEFVGNAHLLQGSHKPVDSGVDAVRPGCHSLSGHYDHCTPETEGTASFAKRSLMIFFLL